MPHQCLRCNTLYDNDAPEMMAGCACGAKAFLFIRSKDSARQRLETASEHITDEKRAELVTLAKEEPLILDIENIRMTQDGKYELDLGALFGKKELSYNLEDGKYSIDLEESFKKMTK